MSMEIPFHREQASPLRHGAVDHEMTHIDLGWEALLQTAEDTKIRESLEKAPLPKVEKIADDLAIMLRKLSSALDENSATDTPNQREKIEEQMGNALRLQSITQQVLKARQDTMS